MLLVLSPAKALDYESKPVTTKYTQPDFLAQSSRLVKLMQQKSPDELKQLMGISENLAVLNVERFREWQPSFNTHNAKQALLAFNGDVYEGINAPVDFSEADFDYAQDHLRILSGLYGVLRPLDLMMPYRLEMGTKLENAEGKNLYAFWGSSITNALQSQLEALNTNVLVNLASNEYFKSVKPNDILGLRLVTPVFKDEKNGNYKVISFLAKKARGSMAKFILKNRLSDPEDLKGFQENGYSFSESQSTEKQLVFLR